MKYVVTLKDKTYEVEVEQGEALHPAILSGRRRRFGPGRGGSAG